MKISIFWFRRDLRLKDNTALTHALRTGNKILPLFIFDSEITEELDNNDPRISFIYKNLKKINTQLRGFESSILILQGKPIDIWHRLAEEYQIAEVYINRDYEPYAVKRDKEISDFLSSKQIKLCSFKDQVIFEKNEILKADEKPYTVYTPYKNKWLKEFSEKLQKPESGHQGKNYAKMKFDFPSLESLGFRKSGIEVSDTDFSVIGNYENTRDIPSLSTSFIGPHLRFGTISIRETVFKTAEKSSVFLSELIWREFFMQIMHHFPGSVNNNFRSKYDGITWRNNEEEIKKWKSGVTGYPIVDAGMRELNKTGFMHNRVRMITASFLCKHLLADWRIGEAYFAQKLLDYELSSNVGNWQWVAGTGCDAAPYFRVFNPLTQAEKFDPELIYIRKWVPEYGTDDYPEPMVDHKFARDRAIKAYRDGIE